MKNLSKNTISKFKDGDVVRIKPEARDWGTEAKEKLHTVGSSKMHPNHRSDTIRECVDKWPEDFELVASPRPLLSEMPKPHKHAELIKKWADGAKIQYLEPDAGNSTEAWFNVAKPSWDLGTIYRVQPEHQYPQTTIDASTLKDLFHASTTMEAALVLIANEAIKQYIITSKL